MPKDFLKDAKPNYDVIVIGSGLGGMTTANILAMAGYSVLLLERRDGDLVQKAGREDL